MHTAQRDFEQTTSFGATFKRRAGRPDHGARVRLGLAVAGLGVLVGWGVVDHLQTDSTVDAREMASAGEERLSGHGKWTGYTSR